MCSIMICHPFNISFEDLTAKSLHGTMFTKHRMYLMHLVIAGVNWCLFVGISRAVHTKNLTLL